MEIGRGGYGRLFGFIWGGGVDERLMIYEIVRLFVVSSTVAVYVWWMIRYIAWGLLGRDRMSGRIR